MVVCSRCNSSDTTSADDGSVVCVNCGLVLGDQCIVSELGFQEGSNGVSSTVGQYRGFYENGRRRINMVASALKLKPHHAEASQRLCKTWEELGRKEEKMFEEYDQLTSPNGSFINYREELHNANPPCIPYMGVYLSDLTFIEEGNPDKLENGQVNFFKCRMVAEVIKEIQQYQQKPYNLIAVPAIISYLNNIKTLSANDLFKLSLVAEPREPQPQ